MYVSANDLHPQLKQIYALPKGVLIWFFKRETSIITLNLINIKTITSEVKANEYSQSKL